MPLPDQNTVWPPAEWAPAFEQFTVNDAWYSGDVDALHAIYSGTAAGVSNVRGDSDAYHYNKGNGNTGIVRRAVDRVRSWFTGQGTPDGEKRTRLHSPLAGNLATLSADILFSEPPTTRMMKDGKSVKDTEGAADGPQGRLDDLVNSPATNMTMIQAAEYVAGLSAVALTVGWDAENSDRPWIQTVACDAVVPRWVGNRLDSVTLWTTYPVTTAFGILDAVYYHVESHERGVILHGLYRGTPEKLGELVPLDSIDATAHIMTIPGTTTDDGLTVAIPTGIDKLTATYWRNLPTKRLRKRGVLSRLGRADFEGVEHTLDQVDMVWSSWMRDIKLARARLIVPNAFLDGQGGAPAFDDDREILKSLEYVSLGNNETIQAQQFEIRATEHAATILALTKEVLQAAGYSLSSYGEQGDQSKTATEVVDRTTATERTRDKKALYFIDAVVPLFEAMLAIDAKVYGMPGLPDGASLVVSFPEISQIDPEKEARVFQYLRAAMAASTSTLVRERHPEWEDDEVNVEVAKILAENGMSEEAPDPALAGRVNSDGTVVGAANPGDANPVVDPEVQADDTEDPEAA